MYVLFISPNNLSGYVYHFLSTFCQRKSPQSPVWPFTTKCLEEHGQILQDHNTEVRCYVILISSTIYLKAIHSIETRSHRYFIYSSLAEASATLTFLKARQKALYSVAFKYRTSTPISLYSCVLRTMIVYC